MITTNTQTMNKIMLLKKGWIGVIMLLFHFTTNAQSLIEWQSSLGGSAYDRAFSIIQTADGGYISTGVTSSTNGDVNGNHGDGDVWVVKQSVDGTVEWTKTYGGTAYDRGIGIAQTTDGGYVIVAETSSIDGDVSGHHGLTDYWIIKVTNTGIIDWQKTCGGSNDDDPSAIVQTPDGGFLVGGTSESIDGDVSDHHGTINFTDNWLVKLNASGTIEWTKSYGDLNCEYFHSLITTSDGGYIFAGDIFSPNGDVLGGYSIDWWIVKLSSDGTIEWEKQYGGSDWDAAYSIVQTNEGGYIIGGMARSHNGDLANNQGYDDFWIVKTTEMGVVEWKKSLGGDDTDVCRTIIQANDGSYIAAGTTASVLGDVVGNHGYYDSWIVNLTNNGEVAWTKTFGGTGEEYVHSILQSSDGGFLLAGVNSSNDGDVIGNQGSADFWIMKLFQIHTGISTIDESTIQIYPNPTSSSITVETDETIEWLMVYDCDGTLIKTETQSSFSVSELESGIYFLGIKTKSGIVNQRFIKG